MQFLQQMINGIHIGSIYALVALGYSMVYGIVKLINFAHGDIIMVGAYVSWYCIAQSGLPVWLSVLITIIFCALLGISIEAVAYRPLRKSARISLLITAIGISFLLQNLAQLIFSPTPKTYPSFISGAITFSAITISVNTLMTVAVSTMLMIGLTMFINRTKTGKAMRAVSEDTEAAQLMGINVNRTISTTFAVGSALAAVAAILYCNTYPTVNPMMGGMLGLKAFVAAVLGGIGSLPGAMIGGFAIGIIESLTKGYISSNYSDAVVFGILIIMLFIKPTGILGRKTNEKV